MVRDHRVLIVLVALVFAGAAFGYSARQEPVYAAEVSLQYKDINEDLRLFDPLQALTQTAENRAALAAAGIVDSEITGRAAEILGGGVSEGEISAAITANAEARTNLVVVISRAPDGRRAAAIANAVARGAREAALEDVRNRYRIALQAVRRQREELGSARSQAIQRAFLRAREAELEENAKVIDPVRVVRQARVPSRPVAPKPVRNTVLGLLVGLTLGILAAFLRDSLDRRFRNSREISTDLELPIVGHVREEVLGRTVTDATKRSALNAIELEAFRILRTNVEFLDVDAPPKLVIVTSALPEEGKSTVAAAYAGACALAGKRTLLVECDLRRPTQAARLGLEAIPGLTDYLAGQAAPGEILQTVAMPTELGSPNGGPGSGGIAIPLVCIVSGTFSPQPAELLRSERCRSFFEQVKEVYDAIVVDTSPLLSVVDTRELLPLADGVLVCVRASHTTRDQARAAKQTLEHFPKRPTGVVITGTRARDEAQAYGYYSYAYAYSDRA